MTNKRNIWLIESRRMNLSADFQHDEIKVQLRETAQILRENFAKSC